MGLNKPSNISGVAVHNELTGRNDADGHPIGAITGLQTLLTEIDGEVTTALNTANTASSTAGTANTNATEAETKADDALAKIGNLASLPTTNKASLVGAITENFTNANNGKVVIASAVNGKGGTANDSMTFSQLADAVTAIPNIDEATGDALAGDVRSGKTFSNDVGNGISGTLDLSNLIAGNIKQGVTIDGVLGTLPAITTFNAGTKVVVALGLGDVSVLPATWTKLREAKVKYSGTVSIGYMLRASGATGPDVYARVYKNGVATGTEKFTTTTAGIVWTENIVCNANDLIQVYARGTGSVSAIISNFWVGTGRDLGLADLQL